MNDLSHTPTPVPVLEEERSPRIPPWAMTAVSVAVATAAVIGWGEVRFVRRDVYDIAHASLAADLHRQEERVDKHEADFVREQQDSRALSDRLIRIEGRLDAIADKLGVNDRRH